MSAFVLVLAAGMTVGNGPVGVSMDVKENLSLSGEWVGTIACAEGILPARLTVRDCPLGGLLELRCGGENKRRLQGIIVDDRGSRFRLETVLGRKGEPPILAICRQDGDRLTICWRRGLRPTSFHFREDQHLLTLRRARHGK
jgi:hypothetical protein